MRSNKPDTYAWILACTIVMYVVFYFVGEPFTQYINVP